MMTIKNWIRKKSQQLAKQTKGAALIVTLMVVMVLVLLALALTLQSQTEYAISINEQDAMTSLAYGEEVIDWLNNIVVDYATLPEIANDDLDELLVGPDDTSGTSDDYLPDLAWTCCGQTVTLARTLNTGIISLNQLNETNEQTTSGLMSFDWDGPGGPEPSVTYQFFRMGINTGGGSDWDGPRAEVYVRIEDNYDDAAAMNTNDTDFRMIGRIVVDYPVFVDSNGTRIPEGRAYRGAARRKLVARFAPAGNVAIRTDGDLEVNGSLEVCGACGSVHGNQQLEVAGETRICGQATGTEGISTNHSDPTLVRGGAGMQGPIFIPRINPYDDRWVPPTDLFTTSDEDSLPDYLECPGPTAPAWDPTKDPGASKYFAIVLKRQTGHVWELYKAYRDSTNSKWVWRLIDTDLSDGTAIRLDNCGRITAGTSTPDPIPDVSDTTYWGGAGAKPDWAGVSVTNASGFYGFEPGGGNRGDFQTTTCTSDDTLNTVFMNDFSGPYNRVIVGTDPFATDTVIVGPTEYTTFTAATSADPLLPGTYGLDWDTAAGTPNPVRDGQRDFRYEDALQTGQGGGSRNQIEKNDDIYSPLFKSVFFIYGNLEMNGTGTFRYVDGSPAANLSGNLVDTAGYWPVSFIVFNAIRMEGNPIYGPPGSDFPVTFVAGRDIEMRGTGNAHQQGSQATCPSGMDDVSTDCTADPPNPNGREGMVLAHEEVTFAGNVSFDGFIVAEDAATCTDLQTNETNATGSTQVHYDCENPPNLWGDRSVRIVGWEEVQ